MNGAQQRASPSNGDKARELIESAGYEFFDAETGLCPNCGELFRRSRSGRPRRFCSEKCRTAFHNKHPNKQNWKCVRKVSCPVCGKEFTADHEYNRERKYCSHACANRGRAMERREITFESHLSISERRGNDDRDNE